MTRFGEISPLLKHFKSLTAIFKTIIQFYQNLGVPVLGLPQDFMYEKDLFYDSIYHLNNEGIEIRTQQTLTLLKRYLAHH